MAKRARPKTVLLLEDEPLIAIDVAGFLEDAGFEVIEMISSCEGAKNWLDENTPDLAVLDPKLRDGYCDEVASILADRKIPFVVYSGEPARTKETKSIFLRGEWVEKPAEPSRLLSAIRIVVALQERRSPPSH